jgi:predicted short-subunit dehydrogenase-like oxidoreductase (DUF2520 family)
VTKPTPEVFVIGAGTVGTALAMKLSRAGIPVAGLHGRRPDQVAAAGAMAGVLGTSGEFPELARESDILVLAVQDDAIAGVVAALRAQKLLRKEHVLLHCSGAMPAAEALAPAKGLVRGMGTLHPLLSIADARSAAAALRGATITIEGDSAGREAARQLALALGGVVHEIDAHDMRLYHAAGVLASNYVVALVDGACSLLVRAGFAKDEALHALLPFINGTVRNLAEVGLPQALTGPVARGDAGTVRAHLAALAEQAPELEPLYREAGRRAVTVAERLGRASATQLREIEAALGAAPRVPARAQAAAKRATAKASPRAKPAGAKAKSKAASQRKR